MAIEQETQGPCPTLKSLPQMLIGCHFIPDGKNKGNIGCGSEDSHPGVDPSE